MLEISLFCVGILAVCFVAACNKKSPGPVKPPVDLNEKVTNPNLIAAIKGFSNSQSDSNLDTLITELSKANFLAAAVMDNDAIEPTDDEGQSVVEKDSVIELLMVELESGDDALCLFTDWDEIAKHTDRKVSGMVLPSWQAWKLVLKNNQLAIINPSGTALPLDREQITDLERRSEAYKPH